ncbi:hypothetical protein NHQ30_000119 [Ciborinia camelliae]|nr:hypothetical protein NHQ30_000119 [Ciborinia camelliae]
MGFHGENTEATLGGGGLKLESRIKSEPDSQLVTLTSRVKAGPAQPQQLSSTLQLSGRIEPTPQLRIKSEPTSQLLQSSSPQVSQPSIKNEANNEDEHNNNILQNTPVFNLEDAITQLVESKFTASDINPDPVIALQELKGLLAAVKIVAARCRRGANPGPDQWEKVKLFLFILHSCIAKVTAEFSKATNLKRVLELFTDPVMKFPQVYSDLSRALINEIEAQNGFETPSPSPKLTTNTKRSLRSADNNTPLPTKRLRGNPNVTSSRLPAAPPSDHHIYGENGIMRGFLWDGVREKLNPETAHLFKKDFHILGHNNLVVGDCWPRQLQALRDGAHGSSQGGISGNAIDGAYSILLSNPYSGSDQDSGDEILYSAPNAAETKSKKPDSENSGVRTLQRSIETKIPVRVLRKAGCEWKNGPAMGIRYDGLYQVVGRSIGTNGKGGKFWRYKLERLGNQDPIRISMPDRELMKSFEMVKNGY